MRYSFTEEWARLTRHFLKAWDWCRRPAEYEVSNAIQSSSGSSPSTRTRGEMRPRSPITASWPPSPKKGCLSRRTLHASANSATDSGFRLNVSHEVRLQFPYGTAHRSLSVCSRTSRRGSVASQQEQRRYSQHDVSSDHELGPIVERPTETYERR